MRPHYLSTFLVLTLTLMIGCTPINSIPSEELITLESSLLQCIDIQNSQSENLTKLGSQVTSLGTSLDLLSEQFVQNNNIETLPLSCDAFDQEPSKLIVGRQEVVWLQDLQLALPARVDTGAETASIDARNIETFERDGKTWVRFDILDPETNEPLQLERLLKRRVSIIQSNTTEAERRAVIELGITIGSIKQTAEFTLSDRSHLNHQMLIGRNILKDVMIVDVSLSNVAPYLATELSTETGAEESQ